MPSGSLLFSGVLLLTSLPILHHSPLFRLLEYFSFSPQSLLSFIFPDSFTFPLIIHFTKVSVSFACLTPHVPMLRQLAGSRADERKRWCFNANSWACWEREWHSLVTEYKNWQRVQSASITLFCYYVFPGHPFLWLTERVLGDFGASCNTCLAIAHI